MTFTFKPPSARFFSSTITVRHAVAPRTPLKITLSGMGVEKTAIDVFPSHVNFLTVPRVGLAENVTLTNTSDHAIEVAVDGSKLPRTYYTLTGDLNPTIPSMGSAEFGLFFQANKKCSHPGSVVLHFEDATLRTPVLGVAS